MISENRSSSERGSKTMITIVTPTYNRAYILPEAFQSLRTQTSFDFEWIIVDDGSSDNTEEVVKEWLSQDLPFSMRYYKQENGGKHRAVNRGVMMAEYEGKVYIAAPIKEGKPFPPLPIFYFGQRGQINGSNYLLFTLVNGRLQI